MTTKSIFDTELLKDLHSHPMKIHRILISCSDDIQLVKTAIKQTGIDITGEMDDLNIIQATIVYEDLVELEKLEGIEWVEADQDVSIV